MLLRRLVFLTDILFFNPLKNYICNISGYSEVAPYISDINPIIYLWHDEEADKQFPKYLEFMKKVYKTDKVEIEVI